MSTQIPERASAVIIGGGVIGASVAYHLAKQGWTDVVLLERKQFSCGTTWHAAGLVGTMRANESHAKLCEYSMAVLKELEEETGQSTGFKQVGSLTIAHSEARFEEIKRIAAMNNAFGITQVDMVTPEEAKAIYPFLKADDLLGACWVGQDGTASPVDVTMSFVKGARGRGVKCIEGITVTDVTSASGAVTGVMTDQGPIVADFVVNCGGLWARDLGKLSGVSIPLHACEHYYAITEKQDNIPHDLPVLRDHDRCAYYREDAGSLLVGAFEKHAVAWGQQGVPKDFAFEALEGHMDEQLMPVLEDAMERLPFLQDVGWRKFFCGPESFTPDDQFHMGEAPELKNYYVACGLNSVGIQTSGGLGRALAEWMHKGHAPMDLWGNDIRRMFPFQSTQNYIEERVTESLGLLYENHYPYRQMTTSRNIRHSPIHEKLASHNACFGEASGWERPNWYAPKGVEPQYEYSFGKQNWFEYSAAEHKAAREKVVLFDQSSFSKYLVQGRDACKVLQRISSANVDVAPGQMVYTHWLNDRGGIEADLTVTRLAEDQYWIVSGSSQTIKDLNWLQRNIANNEFCCVSDITNTWAVFGIQGPDSRALLTETLKHDMTTQNFGFGSFQKIELGSSCGYAARVSYVGELGWELYVPVDQARHAFDCLWEKGQSHGLSLAGMHALDSCRMEKKFVHYGHDVAETDTPLECGMSFVCDFNKSEHFIGRDAILKQKESRSFMKKRLVQFLLEDPESMLYSHEPILRDGKIVGHLTSGNYGHTLGGSVGLGYIEVEDDITKDYLESGKIEIDVAGVPVAAKASLVAQYDPKAARMRS
jgi:glycine cleavage system aminomethyltransferase T/glycine/D-amino acid oxidase-like deaminating enzyme